MSASDKKKLRKEQNAAAITNRQKQANKEAKQLKIYTTIFISAMALVLVAAIFIGLFVANGKPAIGWINNATTAVEVDGTKLSTVDLNYYYKDYIQSFADQYSDYGTYASTYLLLYTGLDVSKPLDEQTYNKETGETWADYFTTSAKENAKWAYGLYNKAVAEGYKMTDTEQKNLDMQKSNLEIIATYYGYSSTAAYLRGVYGPGASIDSYMEYSRINAVANSYANAYYNGLEFKDADYREYEKDKLINYNSYSFSYYYCSVNDFLTYNGGGKTEKDESGKETTTYTDEQKETARKDAEAAAKGLAVADNATLEALNAAIKKLPIHSKKTEKELESINATENKLVLSGSIQNADFKKWITDKDRKPGDITTIEIKSGEGEKATVSGYYVLLYQEMSENKQPLANVQHILVKFTGGTKDTTTGETTYSDEEKKSAKLKAEAILDEFLKGEKQDSEAFGKLAGTKSEDTGSKETGGLIEGIYRDANYVQSFKDWALDNRKPGDTGIIESEYGYHVMFYKEDGKLSYRDYMIDIDLTNDRYEKWETAIVEKVTVTDKNLDGLDSGFVIAG